MTGLPATATVQCDGRHHRKTKITSTNTRNGDMHCIVHYAGCSEGCISKHAFSIISQKGVDARASAYNDMTAPHMLKRRSALELIIPPISISVINACAKGLTLPQVWNAGDVSLPGRSRRARQGHAFERMHTLL